MFVLEKKEIVSQLAKNELKTLEDNRVNPSKKREGQKYESKNRIENKTNREVTKLLAGGRGDEK